MIHANDEKYPIEYVETFMRMPELRQYHPDNIDYMSTFKVTSRG